VYCNGRREEFLRELSSRQANIVEEGSPTLEEIFVVRSKTREIPA
jgi:hypothetical protein